MASLTLSAPSPVFAASTRAQREADSNVTANLDAIAGTQPALLATLRDLPEPAGWSPIFGRDGSLTFADAAGRWWGGCSVPAAAGRAMLRRMEVGGTTAVFLSPPHAGALRVALDKLRRSQAIIAAVPEWDELAVMLRSADFSDAITDHRLWLAPGPQWDEALAALLRERPGLPPPQQFVRVNATPAQVIDGMIARGNRAIADLHTRMAAELADARRGWKPSSQVTAATRTVPSFPPPPILRGRDGEGASQWTKDPLPGPLPEYRGREASSPSVLVVAQREFRLWDDAPAVLAKTLADDADVLDIRMLHADDPAEASTLALAKACAGCDAVVLADMGRADMPDVLADDIACITWVTTPRVPAAKNAGPNDALLLADPNWREIAAKQGWLADRVKLASWPSASDAVARVSAGEWPQRHRGTEAASRIDRSLSNAKSENTTNTAPHTRSDCAAPKENQRRLCASVPLWPSSSNVDVAIIADTSPLDPPESLEQFSSHRLLWTTLREELLANPFAAGDDAEAYLRTRMDRYGVSSEGMDARLFRDRLILPAYAQGVARLLIAAGLAVRLHGTGWAELPEFADHAGHEVTSRAQLASIIADYKVLVAAWPARHAHAIDALGRPVVRAAQSESALIRAVQSALRSPPPTPHDRMPPLSAERVMELLRRG